MPCLLQLQTSTAQAIVDNLNIEFFKDHVQDLSSVHGPTGGSRYWSNPGNEAALDYLEQQFVNFGYTNVERHEYIYSGVTKENVYATKLGTTEPNKMYIISAHMDSINFDSSGFVFAPGANDDASGCALVLEAARVFADPSIQTRYSIRFILWNNEETGLNGSSAYASQRDTLQKSCRTDPPPAGQLCQEPEWLGIIQHDQILWDHGPDPELDSDQREDADLDIEYRRSTTYASGSLALANSLAGANVNYGVSYPAEVSNDMCCTDSWPFRNRIPGKPCVTY